MINTINGLSKLLLTTLDYHERVGFLQWHTNELRKCANLYLFYLSQYEIPAYRAALFEHRFLSDIEWRNVRWHSVLMNLVCVYEWSDDVLPDIVPINDTMYTLLNQEEGLRNDIYLYPRDVTGKRKICEYSRVVQLMHEENLSVRQAMIGVATRAQKMLMLLMDVNDYLPMDAKKYMDAAIFSVAEITSLICNTKRYNFTKVQNN